MPTPRENLEAALSTVDWAAHVTEFIKDAEATESLAQCNFRVAVWAKQLEIIEKDNSALPFIREMQIQGQYVAALVALALYKPAAAAMRTMFESALYYTYFRSHPSELATLHRDADYYVDKTELVEYHMRHTPNFNVLQNLFGLIGKLKEWYKLISSITHGQLPGAWVKHTSLAKLQPVPELKRAVLDSFTEGEQIIHQLLLCTVAQEIWNDVAPAAKKALLAGLAGDVKAALRLDVA